MYSILLVGFGLLFTYRLAGSLWHLRKNAQAAKASGLPYTLVPIYVYSVVWLVVNHWVVGLLKKTPTKYRPLWTYKVGSIHVWDNLWSSFEDNPAATYMTVSPGGCMLWTANAEVISQLTTRRTDFPKPGHMYRALNIYGTNLVSVEGQTWRRHRKVTGPPFTEKNNQLVWAESLAQASYMIRSWTGEDGNESRTITTVSHDCMRLTLHVISRAGFGVRLLWPGIQPGPKTDSSSKSEKMDATALGEGHKMTYTEALETLLHNMVFIVACPHGLLKRLPFKKPKLAWTAFLEWGKYMNEMMQQKKVALASGQGEEGGMDLMGALVKSAGYGAENSLEKGQTEPFRDDEILGNAFVFILAGHETTGNTIHFSLIYLAMRPAAQRKLQAELDGIFGKRKPTEWNYDRDLPHLFGGMTGAVMNETLRLIPPAINIPKFTTSPQSFTVDGKEYHLPANTLINISACCAHRNPRYWPTGPPSNPAKPIHPTSNVDNDLEEFKPERWLLSNNGDGSQKGSPTTGLAPDAFAKSADTEELSVNTAADTAASLFKPEKCAYIPFSEGFRSCIGRRFAQVETLVVLAAILKDWSVELAADEWASDEDVKGMGAAEKREVWEKASDKAQFLLRERMGVTITMKLRDGYCVPLRFVRRGKERFDYDV